MVRRTLLAADFGTTSVKLGLMDQELTLLDHQIEAYPLTIPAEGQAEQAPEDWWAALARGVRALRQRQDVTIEGLVFSAQMCGLVCADAEGRALRPAMIWRDKRGAAEARSLIGGWPSYEGYRIDKLLHWVRLANGAPSRNGMDPVAKIRFIQNQEPATAAATSYYLDVRDWLLTRATGAFATTADCANLTWMMDTRPGHEGWSPALAARAGINLARMPPIVEGTAEVGGLTAAAATELGLASGTPVFAGCGDVTAAAIGTGAVADGALHICLSTGAWIGGFFDRRVLSASHSYATVLSPFGNRPLLIAAQEAAGGVLGWGRTTLADGTEWEAGPYAQTGPARIDDPIVFPWFAGERVPRDDDRLRGAILGLSPHHDAAALRRALVEGVALNLAWAWEKVIRERGVRQDAPVPIVGGGAMVPVLVQSVADAIGRPVALGEDRFAGVVGTGLVGAAALGWVPDLWRAAETRAQAHGTRIIEPTSEGRRTMARRGARVAKLRRHILKATADLGDIG
jgi:xylulokinase